MRLKRTDTRGRARATIVELTDNRRITGNFAGLGKNVSSRIDNRSQGDLPVAAQNAHRCPTRIGNDVAEGRADSFVVLADLPAVVYLLQPTTQQCRIIARLHAGRAANKSQWIELGLPVLKSVEDQAQQNRQQQHADDNTAAWQNIHRTLALKPGSGIAGGN
jgi:hypothetical protein